MRILLGLVLLTLMAGGIVGVIAAVNLVLNRNGARGTFLALANQFLCTGLALAALIIANSYLPRSTTEYPIPLEYLTPRSYGIWMAVAYGLLGLGVWPAALRILIVARKRLSAETKE